MVGSKADPTKIYHYPPEVAKLPAMIEDLIAFANEDDEFIHPIVKAIILHFLIGYIHPFNDGNGRTARAIFYWFALKHHYELLEYISISRIFVHAPVQYSRAYQLTETDSNDMTYFIDFNIHILKPGAGRPEEIHHQQKGGRSRIPSAGRADPRSLLPAG